jgi:outer membrane biosynthesis protein TonB
MTELGGSQITTLLETLPGIAQVLRSPVADAVVNLIRAGARLREFQLKDAEELVNFAIRRGLLGQSEGERVLAEAQAATERRQEKAAERAAGRAAKTPARPAARAAKKPAPKPAPKPAAKKPVAKPAARGKPRAAAKPKPRPAKKR